MNTYLVSYDLLKQKNYATLHEHLKSYYSWAKPLESLWLIKSNLDYDKVRDAVRAHIDSDDRLLVVDVTKRAAAWVNLSDKLTSWIKTNL